MSLTHECLSPAQLHARRHVGGIENFDVVGARLFCRLVEDGLREEHALLDIGCGCLRVGKLLIPYLRRLGYCGVEPDRLVLEAGKLYELGDGLIEFKRPRFSYRDTYDFGEFAQPFDVAFAGSVLSHTYQTSAVACLRGVRAVLKSDGFFLATFIEAGTPFADRFSATDRRAGEGWAPGGLVYTQQDMTKFAAVAGFDVWFDAGPSTIGQSFALFRPVVEDV